MATLNRQIVTHRELRDDPYIVRSGLAEGQYILANVIWLIGSLVIVLLTFRFVLTLAGANPANGFANFIYTVSHPLVAPFFSLFSYTNFDGVASFEGYTLAAIAVYAALAWALTSLVTINR